MGGDDDFSSVDIDVSPEAVFVTEHGRAVAFGSSGYPLHFWRGVFTGLLVFDSHAIVVVSFHDDVC